MLFRLFVRIREYLFHKMWFWGGYEHDGIYEMLSYSLHIFMFNRVWIDFKLELRPATSTQYKEISERYLSRARPIIHEIWAERRKRLPASLLARHQEALQRAAEYHVEHGNALDKELRGHLTDDPDIYS
jgi:hypothetical protein